MKISLSHYTPFGSCIQELQYVYADAGDTSKYRFGFNGEESESYISGDGMVYDLGERFYDGRLGRMFSVDPLAILYCWQSSYAYCLNSPISKKDFKGLGNEIPDKSKGDKVRKGEGLVSYMSRNGLNYYNKDDVALIVALNPEIFTKGNMEKGNYMLHPGMELVIRNPNKVVKEIIWTRPTIITREEWGASPIKLEKCGNEKREYTLVGADENGNLRNTSLNQYYSVCVIHHSGNSNTPTINEVQDIHINDKCKADIAYHFAVDLKGNIYEGRSLQVKGAHVAQANTGKIGIVILGDLSSGPWYDIDGDNGVNLDLYASLYHLVAWLNQEYGFEGGLAGHNEINCGHTLCPGNLSTGLINFLRNEMKLKKPECTNNLSDE